jgi:hypothetical protein
MKSCDAPEYRFRRQLSQLSNDPLNGDGLLAHNGGRAVLGCGCGNGGKGKTFTYGALYSPVRRW